ncbi:VOC family protein [Alicyclobacillus vulcanalis]|uniref:Catechol 2,3-dioxygenase n=2 Tax=Alicyclobacillus TaxID=29330 RepID=A0A1N7NX54_9BACL|nr:VOC family protein [Alicyclobacillus vulcanalis]SIT02913.1 catechol 2,3-dioxygenase [Alicyclobacillus vulcanalis]
MKEEQEFKLDVAHIAHVELLTPTLQDSLCFFRDILGLRVVAQEGKSIFLRAYWDQQIYSLKLTESPYAGLGHLSFRAQSRRALERIVHDIEDSGLGMGWIDGDYGHGPAYRFRTPNGHLCEVFDEAKRYCAPKENLPYLKNQPDVFLGQGLNVQQFDHCNLFSSDVDSDTRFLRDVLGFRLSEVAIDRDGKQTTAWLHVTNKSYDLAISRDQTGLRGRFHHLAYRVDSLEAVMRAADLFMERGVYIEVPPNKHVAGQTIFVYVYEPGGNRIEVCSGGFLIYTPDWETVTWSAEERRRGLAWGTQLPASFHRYGTPVHEQYQTTD